MTNENNHPEIPKGDYCYTILGVDKDTGKLRIKVCPHWSRDPKLEEQMDGCCAFLKTNDTESRGGLLWDMVKECSENLHDDENLQSCDESELKIIDKPESFPDSINL